MPEKSKRILIFTTAFRPFIGGSEIALEHIIKGNTQHSFIILTPRLKPGLPRHENHRNYDLYRIGIGSIFDKYIFPLIGCLTALWLLQKHSFRLAHSFQASQAGGAAWLLKWLYPSLPLIVTLQEGKDLNNQSFFVRWIRSLIIRQAEVITAISNYLLNYAVRINPKARIILAPNGVSEIFFIRQPAQPAGGPADKSKRENINIITVSRLVRKNAVDLALKAFKEFKTLHPDSVFTIIGQGAEEKNLKHLASELDISDSVRWIGEIPYESIPDYLGRADIFIRLPRSEGLGTAFLEAMACGVPVIGTSVGGIPDFLKDKETGLIVPPENFSAATEAMAFLVSHQAEKNAIIENARIMVRKKYTWPAIAGQFSQIYDSY